MKLRGWLRQRLDVACVALHVGELGANCVVVSLLRRVQPISIPVQILSFLLQLFLVRLCVSAYLYWRASETMRSVPSSFRIPLHREVVLIFRESLGAVGLYSVLHPFAGLIMRSFETAGRPAQCKAQYPVLFIHGYVCNAGFWYPVLRFLQSSGVSRLHTISLEPLHAGIPDYAAQVAKRVEQILSQTKSEKIILVAHSMGGLVARAYMKWHAGEKNVAKLLTLQTPHHGTEMARVPLARLLRSNSIEEMLPGSAFLDELGREGEELSVPIASVFSYHDPLISPQSSSCLQSRLAKNIPLSGLGHLMLPFVPEVQKLILHELTNWG